MILYFSAQHPLLFHLQAVYQDSLSLTRATGGIHPLDQSGRLIKFRVTALNPKTNLPLNDPTSTQFQQFAVLKAYLEGKTMYLVDQTKGLSLEQNQDKLQGLYFQISQVLSLLHLTKFYQGKDFNTSSPVVQPYLTHVKHNPYVDNIDKKFIHRVNGVLRQKSFHVNHMLKVALK